ncbi:ATP-binding cassette domain-containing protein [Rhodovulum sp. DZ06]|uniref:ATP-binding cassette domain-containing protein n=1 Tax=Rhodovulum sp. DZ06 TaxID=3425126 RepID=UPI003D334E2F
MSAEAGAASALRGLPLAVRNLSVRAGGREILRAGALDLAPGRLLGLHGPSGAGKTTLLHALAGLAAPSAGSVRWGGTDLAALSPAGREGFRRAHMGLIFQDFLLFEELPALANAALPADWAPRAERAAIRARAAAALARLGIKDPNAAVASMSGGERQRVCAARALAGDPAILLADEPTAALDRAAADRLTGDLVRLAREAGRSVVCVTHDARLLDAMDETRRIADGRLEG